MLEIVSLIVGILSVALGFYALALDAQRKRGLEGEPTECDDGPIICDQPRRVDYFVMGL